MLQEIRGHLAPVLKTREMNTRVVNRWNPNNNKSLLMKTTGNIFFDYVRLHVAPLSLPSTYYPAFLGSGAPQECPHPPPTHALSRS